MCLKGEKTVQLCNSNFLQHGFHIFHMHRIYKLLAIYYRIIKFNIFPFFTLRVLFGFQLIIGGPFEHDIESILRDKASSMNSPVVSASDPGIKSIIKSYRKRGDKLIQICDIFINVKKDLPLVIGIELNLSIHSKSWRRSISYI